MQIEIIDLGLVEFKKAWDLQKEIFLRVKSQDMPSALVLCRHYPVITLGRIAKKNNILVSQEELEKMNIQTYEIDRGGDITYHGPGQITAYPIFNLCLIKKDIHFFLRFLEEIVLSLLDDLGVKGKRYPGLTGIWVGRQKIASIGIAIKNWISFHGLSINIKKNDLDNFRLVRPCGMDIKMTSLESVLSREINIDTIKLALIHKFKDMLSVKGEAVLSN
jgi:lipoate-protein ligase B